MAGGCVHMPWYATGFRADGLEEALNAVAPTALRYGATSYQVFRYRDDRYKFLHTTVFREKLDFERWWGGPEMTAFRTRHTGWFQVPMTYTWADITAEGAMPDDPIVSGVGRVESPGDAGDAI